MEWQPIETAPKDVRILFYWLKGYSGRGTKVEIGAHNQDEYYDFDGAMFLYEPTHWMTLPDPPKEDQWQTISTAPKDETRLLILTESGQMIVGLYDCEMWWEQNMEYSLNNPTDWQPLPDPPKKNQ